MAYKRVSPEMFHRYRHLFIRFFRRHGDKRITRQGLNWLNGAAPEELEQEGTYMLCAIEAGRLVGMTIIVRYGLRESYVAVHRRYRNQSIATDLLERSISGLGKVYGRVAVDNTPSLKMCFASGMVAFHLTTGPTGKPTLWLGGGDWERHDVLETTRHL